MADFVKQISGTPAKVAARLMNFATGQSFLLTQHLDFLDRQVQPVVRGLQGAWVDLFGYASRVGSTEFNLALSRRRLDAVKARVAEYANQVNFQIQTALGESESGPDERDNDAYWRAVEVYVYGHRPPPPKPAPATLPGTTQFQIRVVGGLSVAPPVLKGAQSDGYVFQIVDLQHSKFMLYRYTGIAVALPSLPGLPFSFTAPGPFAPFTTSGPVQLFEFEGPATLFQDPGATLGNKSVPSKIRLSFDTRTLPERGVRVTPSLVPMDGGPGLQAPSMGSAPVVGRLVRQSLEMPFKR